MSQKKTFLLIDGHAVIYRAFYAFPKQLTDPTGRLMNAVFGFSRIVLTAIRNFGPEYIAVTFDHPKPSFRKKDFADYKAHREEMPDELKPQIEIIKEVVKALNIPQYEIEGYEADDLIGTVSRKIDEIANKKPKQVKAKDKIYTQVLTIIVTGDQDTFQLVDNNTHVWLPGRGKRQQDKEYDAEDVKGKIGVGPEKVIDLKALMGDSSDNIPGVKGVGPKTALKLLEAFGDLDGVYQAVESGEAEKSFRENLINKLKQDKDNAYLSKQLATIDINVPLEFDLPACKVSGYDKTKAVEIFKKLDFNSLLQLLPEDEFENLVQDTLF